MVYVIINLRCYDYLLKVICFLLLIFSYLFKLIWCVKCVMSIEWKWFYNELWCIVVEENGE